MSAQRWHQWRNMDVTACPSHGVVTLIPPVWIPPSGQVPNGGTIEGTSNAHGNEILGTSVILHGIANQYSFAADGLYLPAADRGLSQYHAFNGDAPVEPGQTGWLTWDLPTWAAVDGSLARDADDLPIFVPGDGIYTFGTVQTLGAPGWTLASVAGAIILFENTGVLYTIAAHPEIKRAWVGAGVTYSIDTIEDERP